MSSGALTDTLDVKYRKVDDHFPVFGFAHDLGVISAASTPVLFSVGHIHDPALSFETSVGLQNRSSYFWSKYSTATDLIMDFLGDYPSALARATDLDARVRSDALKISSDYADIVALSLRQAVGATEITISKTPNGDWNTSDVLMFMKGQSSCPRQDGLPMYHFLEISSDGVSLTQLRAEVDWL
jgi:hypothetical protein